MKHCSLALALAALVCIAALAAPQSPKEEDKKKKDEPAPVIVTAPKLPNGWKDLGLTEKQKTDIRTTRVKYAAKRKALQEQLKKLPEEEMQECEKFLTDGQKKLLKERGKK